MAFEWLCILKQLAGFDWNVCTLEITVIMEITCLLVWLLVTARYILCFVHKFVLILPIIYSFFSACVNCVRWSCGGKYLATGGDDKLIMIWQMARYIKYTNVIRIRITITANN